MATSRICSIPGCDKPHKARGYCKNHLDRVTRNGHPNRLREPILVCTIVGCEKPHQARGYCSAHYSRWARRGSPDAFIGTEKGKAAKFLSEFLMSSPPAADECVQWPFGRNNMGYGLVNGYGFYGYAHRIVCEHVHGAAPTPMHDAAHSCGKGHEGCIHPLHVRWATKSDNQSDRYGHGTMVQGESHPCAKLSEADIPIIRERAKTVSAAQLSREYRVAASTILDAVHRVTWKHVA